MPRRPTSSAASSRPHTAGAFRPTTANQSFVPGFDHDPQYAYDIDEEEEEEEEESDAEDLFAFLPPSTADQEQQRQDHTKSQAEFHDPDLTHHQPNFDQMFAASVPYGSTPGSAAIPPITPLQPAYDPYARYPADTTVGPSTLHFPLNLPPPQSPPSTGSVSRDDPYQMRRMNATNTASSDTRRSGLNSREVHVALPGQLGKSIEEGYEVRPFNGKHRSSTAMTSDTLSGMSLSPSMMDIESREGSVK